MPAVPHSAAGKKKKKTAQTCAAYEALVVGSLEKAEGSGSPSSETSDPAALLTRVVPDRDAPTT